MLSPKLCEENSQRILIVDDARETQKMLALQLERAGYAVITAGDGPQALDLVRRKGLPRLVLLDCTLPGMSGGAVAEAINALGPTPIIMLSTPAALAALDKAKPPVAADYLIKPIALPDLLATMQRVLEQAETPSVPDAEISIDGRLGINFAQHYIVLDGERISLTPTENRLLHHLYMNRGRVVSPGYLMAKAWGEEQKGTQGSLWVHVRRLRNKLEHDPETPQYLRTVRGQGYTFQTGVSGFDLHWQ